MLKADNFDDALVELNKRERYEPATDDEFRAAVLAAWEWLCRGEHGMHVDPSRETWEQALIRVANDMLDSVQRGRPLGDVPDSWVKIIHAAARNVSCAPDGRVEGPRGLRVSIRDLPRSVG